MNILSLLGLLEKEFPEFEWSIPPNLSLGVLTTNQSFVRAKKEKANPNLIADEIKNNLNNFLFNSKIDAVAETAGPYINIKLKQNFLTNYVNSKEAIVPNLKRVDKKVLVEFFSPNVAKKMHVGHIRSGDIGEALRRILSLKYKNVLTNNYLGDWGVQFSYIIWGLENIKTLNVDFEEVDFEKEQGSDIIDKLYKIYVEVNKLVETNPEIKKQCQKKAALLESGLQDKLNGEKLANFKELYSLYKEIVIVSLSDFTSAEKYLNFNSINYKYSRFNTEEKIFDDKSNSFLTKKIGTWELNQAHVENKFDTILGESFYNQFFGEFNFWVERGLAKKEGKAIYFDLEDENLGRCYLISSQGYSLYTARDVAARFVWAGLFETTPILSIVDNRQSHSFKQLFTVIEKLIRSRIYKKRSFGPLGEQKTKIAVDILSTEIPKHIGFGHMNLPEGAMSTRKGKIFEFEKLKSLITEKVLQTLREKSKENTISLDKVEKLSVATLKWADLHRDREQDVIFDINQFLRFEGNTGIYQLYTVARLNSILNRNNTRQVFEKIDVSLLNTDEELILREIYTLPLLLEDICGNYKPHILCNYLFSLSTKINSWYSKHSVADERSDHRKQSLLAFCNLCKEHLWFTLELLGIEPVESL